ncbi:MAG: HDIG domain-containing protein [Nanoarchaeota archaeon]|nr:HDIG domain-containing protein [Nanoarchaeota archaeon]
MKLPSREECFKLLEKYESFPHIVEHSKLVNKIAVYLAKKLKEKGVNINVELVDRASLLHDIGKSIVIRMDAQRANTIEDNHHIVGEEILTKEGYPELAKIVRKHSLKEIQNLETWEEKVVHYADLRVRHSSIVGVKERVEDIVRRYKVPPEKRIDKKVIFALEKEIYGIIGGSPDKLKEEIKSEH